MARAPMPLQHTAHDTRHKLTLKDRPASQPHTRRHRPAPAATAVRACACSSSDVALSLTPTSTRNRCSRRTHHNQPRRHARATNATRSGTGGSTAPPRLHSMITCKSMHAHATRVNTQGTRGGDTHILARLTRAQTRLRRRSARARRAAHGAPRDPCLLAMDSRHLVNAAENLDAAVRIPKVHRDPLADKEKALRGTAHRGTAAARHTARTRHTPQQLSSDAPGCRRRRHPRTAGAATAADAAPTAATPARATPDAAAAERESGSTLRLRRAY
jgi:hypothetical protein